MILDASTFYIMAKPKKKRNPGAIDSSKLPISVKKNVHKYKRVRTKAVLKVFREIMPINICISASFIFLHIDFNSMYKTKS